MKNVFVIAAVLSMFAACTSNTESVENSTDEVVIDSTMITEVDTTVTDSAVVVVDSTSK